MPKLLFVGIVERTCRATVIREIPGITDCFQVKDDSKKGQEPEIKVSHPQMFFYCAPCLTLVSLSPLLDYSSEHSLLRMGLISAECGSLRQDQGKVF